MKRLFYSGLLLVMACTGGQEAVTPDRTSAARVQNCPTGYDPVITYYFNRWVGDQAEFIVNVTYHSGWACRQFLSFDSCHGVWVFGSGQTITQTLLGSHAGYGENSTALVTANASYEGVACGPTFSASVLMSEAQRPCAGCPYP